MGICGCSATSSGFARVEMRLNCGGRKGQVLAMQLQNRGLYFILLADFARRRESTPVRRSHMSRNRNEPAPAFISAQRKVTPVEAQLMGQWFPGPYQNPRQLSVVVKLALPKGRRSGLLAHGRAKRIRALIFCFYAFSSREPASASLENALTNMRQNKNESPHRAAANWAINAPSSGSEALVAASSGENQRVSRWSFSGQSARWRLTRRGNTSTSQSADSPRENFLA